MMLRTCGMRRKWEVASLNHSIKIGRPIDKTSVAGPSNKGSIEMKKKSVRQRSGLTNQDQKTAVKFNPHDTAEGNQRAHEMREKWNIAPDYERARARELEKRGVTEVEGVSRT
jgi:hypothetical protein